MAKGVEFDELEDALDAAASQGERSPLRRVLKDHFLKYQGLLEPAAIEPAAAAEPKGNL
jgi:hypothetical protein